jgi:chemotaxis protein methyltransferase CheR
MTTTINQQQYQINRVIAISDKEFIQLRDLIQTRFGINLTDQKRSLLVGRLQKLVHKLNLPTFSAYYDYLNNDKTEGSLGELVNLVSTNHTYFNREKEHFNYFSQTALPAVIDKLKREKRKDLRIWCAGCSSGEEPYTLLMLMMEYLGAEYSSWDAGILATDISDRALAIARRGTYALDRVMQLPEPLRRKYFSSVSHNKMAIVDKIKKEVTFRRFNLMNTTFPFKKPFQMIFCRNVMIYFDSETRIKVVKKILDSLKLGGYLFVSHSESLVGISDKLKMVQPSVFMKV